MFFTVEQIAFRIKRSAAFVRTCFDRFGIKKQRICKKIVYEINQEQLKAIKNYSETRNQYAKNRIRKID